MTQSKSYKPHSVVVLFGTNAIEAFANGEANLPELEKLEASKIFRFRTAEERKAFILGLEEARGFSDVAYCDETDFEKYRGG